VPGPVPGTDERAPNRLITDATSRSGWPVTDPLRSIFICAEAALMSVELVTTQPLVTGVVGELAVSRNEEELLLPATTRARTARREVSACPQAETLPRIRMHATSRARCRRVNRQNKVAGGFVVDRNPLRPSMRRAGDLLMGRNGQSATN
jgi:hypothetical protein